MCHYVGQTTPDVQWRNKEKRNDKDHHEKARFFSPTWVLEYFFGFVFVKNVFLRSSLQEVFLEISQNSPENACTRVSFLIKLQTKTCNFIKKEALAQVFPCEFYAVSKKTFFTEHRISPFIIEHLWWLLLKNKSSTNI